jgi:hypothetical protein
VKGTEDFSQPVLLTRPIANGGSLEVLATSRTPPRFRGSSSTISTFPYLPTPTPPIDLTLLIT